MPVDQPCLAQMPRPSGAQAVGRRVCGRQIARLSNDSRHLQQANRWRAAGSGARRTTTNGVSRLFQQKGGAWPPSVARSTAGLRRCKVLPCQSNRVPGLRFEQRRLPGALADDRARSRHGSERRIGKTRAVGACDPAELQRLSGAPAGRNDGAKSCAVDNLTFCCSRSAAVPGAASTTAPRVRRFRQSGPQRKRLSH